jgi:hypothetical protein
MFEGEIMLGSDILRVSRRFLMNRGLFEKDVTLLISSNEVHSFVSFEALQTVQATVTDSDIELTLNITNDINSLLTKFGFQFPRFWRELEGKWCALFSRTRASAHSD